MRYHQMIEFILVTCFAAATLIAGCVSGLPTTENQIEMPQAQIQQK